jgi:hypothetical protein
MYFFPVWTKDVNGRKDRKKIANSAKFSSVSFFLVWTKDVNGRKRRGVDSSGAIRRVMTFKEVVSFLGIPRIRVIFDWV